MEPITDLDIRPSFINCSKGAAKRLHTPRDLADQPWADLDFLGWTDPASPGRSYLVYPGSSGLVGLALRYEKGATRRAQMCSVCLTTHPNGAVRLMAAQKAGEAGRRGDTVGIYMCADLDCSLYARRKKSPSMGRLFREDFDSDERVQQIRAKVEGFIARIEG
ncbi:FBP domain-containing protein [Tomitella biformata]|uniref:FBP domain-containing protein n=1 Tax=Tomitella biformata TaxID=630403 RepID=UPI0004669372|nr:FBP domain-containing protein [Tomitella biformata]